MKICAVVVTYNRSALMLECISALRTQEDLAGIVVVNNLSTDDTKDVLESIKSDFIHVIHMSENTGGAGGFHIGLKHSVELGYDASWVMDDDAIPQENSLKELLVAARKLDWDFGFLTSNVQTSDGECMNVPLIDYRPNQSGYSDWPKFAEEGLIKVEIATFVSVFIKNSVVKTLGLPIKEMFIWGDDSEYTQRISKETDSYFVPKSKVVHKRVLASALSVVTEKNPTRITWFEFLYRNNCYRIRKHGNKKDIIKFYFGVIATLAKIIMSPEKKKLIKIKYVIKGGVNGILFNPVILYPES